MYTRIRAEHDSDDDDERHLVEPLDRQDALRRAPVDFEEVDGAVNEQRELLLYALPLYREDDPAQGLVFLPVTNFQETEDYEGLAGKMQKRLDKMQGKVAEAWDDLKQKEESTVGHKLYKVGHKVINNLTPEERLAKNIPKNVTKVVIYHPSQVPPDVIAERLNAVTKKQGKWTGLKAAAASIMLPIAFGVDIIIIPGPSVLTWYTSWHIYRNLRTAVGNQRLVNYLGDPKKAVRVMYAGDPRLDGYYEAVQGSPSGVLDEELCEQLVEDIDQGELLEPVLELRKRRVKELRVRRSSDDSGAYAPLVSNDDHGSSHR